MKRRKIVAKSRRGAANDIMLGLRELAETVTRGVSPQVKFTAHTVSIPEPGKYSPARVKKLRGQLGMSQAVFAELLGVSRVWVQGWELGVRQPSPLARRLMDNLRTNPPAWLTLISTKAS